MHVLSIAPAFSTTGVSVHVEQVNAHLISSGHEITLAPLSVEEPRVVSCGGGRREVRPVAMPSGIDDWFEEKLALADAYVEAIGAELDRRPVDLIHTHDWLAARIGQELAERSDRPHLTTVHTLAEIQRAQVGLPGRLPVHRGQVALEQELCRTRGTVATVSQSMKSLIGRHGHSAPEEIAVIPNGVDLERFTRPAAAAVSELRKRLAPDDEKLILFVGRLAPQKGLDFLLRSTFAVRKSAPNTRWAIVGDHVASHMMKPVYQQVIAEGGYDDHLSFEGQVAWTDIPLYYHAADCVVMPSLFEACPYVALEAMASGTCVIASDLDSLREIVVTRENGLLVPIDYHGRIHGPDVDALADAQVTVLEDATLRARLTDNARTTVRRRFSLAQQLEATDELYANSVGAMEPHSQVAPTRARRVG